MASSKQFADLEHFASSKTVSFLDLNEDVKLYICRFLDNRSLAALTQVCRNIRDLLYQPFLWKDGILCVQTLDIKIAMSVKQKQRQISAIKICGDKFTDETVKCINAARCVSTLVLACDATISVEVVSPGC